MCINCVPPLLPPFSSKLLLFTGYHPWCWRSRVGSSSGLYLEGKHDEVRDRFWYPHGGLIQVAPRVLYKQVAMLLPNVQQLRTLRLRAVVTAPASELEEGSSLLAV